MIVISVWVLILMMSSEVSTVDYADPYHNEFKGECRAGQVNSCVNDKCINIGRYANACTECRNGKVPINGVCSDGSGDSNNPDTSMCIKVTRGESSYCVGCNAKSSGKGGFFLFYGGCYDISTNPGSLICSAASNGVCTLCNTKNRLVFINDAYKAREKCILCSDDIGFDGNQGIKGCSICLEGSWRYAPFQNAGIQCNVCFLKNQAPIDGLCNEIGLHVCADGYCKYCYKTHIYHNGGCYSRAQQYSASICSPNNQFVLGDYTGCMECARKDEVPREGNCMRALDIDNCSKDATKGKCLDCNKHNPGILTFLYMGGCYHVNGLMGKQVCSSASGGVCTNCAINGCIKCNLQSSTIQCDECGSMYISMDKSMCLQTCPSPDQKASQDTPNRCVCNDGYTLNKAGTACYLTSNCPEGVTDCLSCDEDGLCASCIHKAYNIQPDRRSCALGCPENYTGEAGELCHCKDGYILQGTECISLARKAGTTAAIATVIVLLLILLVISGVLCWFFIKKKRLAKKKPTRSLENLGLVTIGETL